MSAAEEINTELLHSIFPKEEVDSEFRAKFFEIIQEDPSFPSFPAAIAKLQERLNQPNTGLEEIAELVRMDPALTGRLFSLLRSAAYGGVKVNSIEEALFRLGLRETRAAIMATKILTRFSHLKAKIDWQKFWVHSLLTARIAQNIADIYQPTSDRAYVAGLLHDTGKLILAHYFPEKFEEIINAVKQTGDSMFATETRLMGTDHAAIGAAVCVRWKMDEEIIYAIMDHHDPEQKTRYPFLTKCLFLANLGANMGEDNIHRKKTERGTDQLNEVQEWEMLSEFRPRKLAVLSIEKEVSKTRDAVEALEIQRGEDQ